MGWYATPVESPDTADDMREIAETPCVLCKERIGYNTKYYVAWDNEIKLAHAACTMAQYVNKQAKNK